MKLTKEDIQKIALGVLLFAGVLYVYVFVLLAQLTTRQTAANKRIEELRPKIDAANKQIQETEGIKAKIPRATRTLDSIRALAPEGAPVAWFPPRIADFMKRHGINRCTTRLLSEAPEKDVSGFKRLSWAVDLPEVEFIPLAIALAGFENEEPLVRITEVNIEARHDSPRFQHVLLTLSHITRE